MWIFALTLAATLASDSIAVSNHGEFPRDARKSLNFGVNYPRSGVHVEGTDNICLAHVSLSDPIAVARDQLRHLTQGIPGVNYVLRDDSYHDEVTGISHVFFRQFVNGLEVADGNIHVNVFNGQVLSWSDSVSCFLKK
jgi:extracellular elastinolytic metalloproteinase